MAESAARRLAVGEIRFGDGGLVPAIVQDARTRRVLMLGYMNEESLKKTLETGYTWFYSRSRGRLWQKGESSGHVQKVRGVLTDCDHDTLLILVEQVGPGACHEGYESCFHYSLEGEAVKAAEREERAFDPDQVYRERTQR